MPRICYFIEAELALLPETGFGRSRRCPSQNRDTSAFNLILEEVVFIRGNIAYDRLVRAPRPTRDRR